MRIIVFSCIVLLTSPAFAGSIGLYADADATTSTLELLPYGTATIHAVAVTDASDPFNGEFVAGNFRVVGVPDSWVATVTPVAGFTLVLGDPLGDGVNFGFPQSVSGTVVLFNITVLSLTAQQDVRLEVVRHVDLTVAWGVELDCPWVLYYCPGPCDIPGTCVETHDLIINPTVAVEATQWSSVKQLFR
jgi:hypothetical protein